MHSEWVGGFATRLRGDGIDVSLDQWTVGLGDPLPELMEKLVRDNERVLVICTPTYKERSDTRIGGVGYEGHLMSGEMFAQQGERDKFVPVLRKGTWIESIPAWLVGRTGVDLRGEAYSESAYRKLVGALYGRKPQVPPLGTGPVVNLVGSFLAQWAAIESAALTLLNKKGISLRSENRSTLAGGGTMLTALSTANLLDEEQLSDLLNLREIRHKLVHFEGDDAPKIDEGMVDRLKQARRNIEKQIEA